MTLYFAFNGDADGLCALQQLWLAERRSGTLITGVKRDISLLERVSAAAGDEVTVLDVSLDVNRAGLLRLLEVGASVRYFDHHHTGEVPQHPRFEPHLDLSPSVCTSILVDRYLGGRFRAWAVTGAFGDNLDREARGLAAELGLAADDVELLRELGVAINYNAYGETIADLHVPPAELASHLREHEDPLSFARVSPVHRTLAEGYASDMEQARKLAPLRSVPGAALFVLPDEAWARRASGTLANELSKASPDRAIAIVSAKSGGSYMVSLRVPKDARVAADAFCRRYPTGGGRRTAAGINQLPHSELERFASEFEAEFRTS